MARPKDTETISFVDVILGLSHEKNIDLYVTGSNSKMLPTDIVTKFRDKANQIHIPPLSFEEFYDYRQGSKTDILYEYMQYGGMLLAVLSDENSKKQYLKGLFETTYFKDAFILQEATRYDIQGKKGIEALRKYYFVDTGLRNARLNFAYPDEGQLLENIVYNELIYNGYTVNIGTFDTIEKNKAGKSIHKTNEIDFLLKKMNINITYKYPQIFQIPKQKIEKCARL